MISKGIKYICSEYWNIENYDKAINDDKMWECHHRLEVSEDGLHTIYSKKELRNKGLMFNRPADELIFLTKSEHLKLHNNTIEARQKSSENGKGKHNNNKDHNPFYGKKHTEETRKKISEACGGENHPNYGKRLSEETRKKMSDAMKAYYAKKKMENQ